MNIFEKLGFSRWSLPHISNEDIECNCPYVYDEEINTVATLGEVDYSRGAAEFILENKNMVARNGRLIASAPEMLEALINVGRYGALKNEEDWQKIQPLIEKATGKSWAEVKEMME